VAQSAPHCHVCKACARLQSSSVPRNLSQVISEQSLHRLTNASNSLCAAHSRTDHSPEHLEGENKSVPSLQGHLLDYHYALSPITVSRVISNIFKGTKKYPRDHARLISGMSFSKHCFLSLLVSVLVVSASVF